jgi:hypothetical protein
MKRKSAGSIIIRRAIRRSDCHRAGCAQILLPGRGERPTIVPHHAEHLGNLG